VAGTRNQGKRVESVMFYYLSFLHHVSYRVHIQDVGWTRWYGDGTRVGTPGSGKRVEAVQILPNEKTCQGRCGSNAPQCWCDAACAMYGDCCADKVDFCG
jgi:hypothetical protein